MIRSSPLLKETSVKRYNYIYLQKGSLPLGPDKSIDRSIEHRCSVALIWPEGETPDSGNTLLTDPCFTVAGMKYAERQLTKLGLSLTNIRSMFITHRHGDHCQNFLCKKKFIYFQGGNSNWLPGIDLVPCPGHAKDLCALVFRSTFGQDVWIVGDAVLNLEWLRAWEYYWPNCYISSEIVQTWESVAKILSKADVIIPGHGDLIHITTSLLKELVSTFPSAEHADNCRNVEELLSDRLQRLLVEEPEKDAKKSCEDQ